MVRVGDTYKDIHLKQYKLILKCIYQNISHKSGMESRSKGFFAYLCGQTTVFVIACALKNKNMYLYYVVISILFSSSTIVFLFFILINIVVIIIILTKLQYNLAESRHTLIQHSFWTSLVYLGLQVLFINWYGLSSPLHLTSPAIIRMNTATVVCDYLVLYFWLQHAWLIYRMC